MGKLIEPNLKRPTIQKIELGHLDLTEDNAAKFSSATGVWAEWLLDGKPRKQMLAAPQYWPVNEDGGQTPAGWDKGLFDSIQAYRAIAEDPDRQRYLQERNRDAYSINLCGEWFGVLAAARDKGEQDTAEYFLGRFIGEMKERFGYDPKAKRYIE
jgi:hypothetical protein